VLAHVFHKGLAVPVVIRAPHVGLASYVVALFSPGLPYSTHSEDLAAGVVSNHMIL